LEVVAQFLLAVILALVQVFLGEDDWLIVDLDIVHPAVYVLPYNQSLPHLEPQNH
jgi:hypothetical protein